MYFKVSYRMAGQYVGGGGQQEGRRCLGGRLEAASLPPTTYYGGLCPGSPPPHVELSQGGVSEL